MFRRCRHRWVEVRRRFVPAVGRAVEVGWVGQEMLDRWLFGFTAVELRCEECGLLREREFLGDARKAVT